MKALPAIGLATLLLGSSALAATKWLPGGNGFLGANPVLVGYEGSDNVPIYVCRADSRPGKLHTKNGKCYTGFNKDEYESEYYDVLQDPSGVYEWKDRNSVTEDDLVRGGRESGQPLYVCRDKSGAGGKLVGGLESGVCYITMWGHEYKHTQFDVLARKK